MLSWIPNLEQQVTLPRYDQNVGHCFTKDPTQQYHHTNRNLSTDNWFTSMPLIKDLLHYNYCGMTIIGTIRRNKPEIPEEMKKNNTQALFFFFLFTKNMTLVSYVQKKKKRKTVLLMTYLHTDQTLANSGKLAIIEEYNTTKKAVDTFAQMCGHFSVSRKSKRWPLRVFFRMLIGEVIYSWIIHEEIQKKTGNETLERKQYMDPLPTELVKHFAVHRHAYQPLSRLKKHKRSKYIDCF